MTVRGRSRCDDQASIPRSRETLDGVRNFASLAHVDWGSLSWRSGLDDSELGGAASNGRITKNRHSRRTRRNLFDCF